jgi:hypothetical protein
LYRCRRHRKTLDHKISAKLVKKCVVLCGLTNNLLYHSPPNKMDIFEGSMPLNIHSYLI